MIANPFSWRQLLKGINHVPEIFSGMSGAEVGQDKPASLLQGAAAAAAAAAPGPNQVLSMVHGIIASMLGPEVRMQQLSIRSIYCSACLAGCCSL